MKDKKLIYIAIIMVCLTVILGISYAWFNTIIEGNENAKKHTVTTGDLRLTYTDTDTITIENAFPGDSYEKSVSVKNAGTANANYSLVWQELSNNILNNELVLEATCKRLNSSGTEEGTCEGISSVAISSLIIKNNVLIEPGYTHEYSLNVTFLDTGAEQNYNKKKSFNGKIGIEEYQVTAFREDDWSTIVANVKAGNTDKYNVGDIREIDLGKYGIHTVRVSNKSTPEECTTEGFSQTACGFVLEFTNILSLHSMNDTNTNNGGWPASAMYTYLNTDLYNEFPVSLKSSIIDTVAVSGGYSTKFTSTDKIYLLATAEVWAQGSTSTKIDSDFARDDTRQLDYYKEKGVTTNEKLSEAVKKIGTTASPWWTRSTNSDRIDRFYSVSKLGYWYNYYYNANESIGVSPAFRIG